MNTVGGEGGGEQLHAYWADNPKRDRLFFVKGLPPSAPQRTHHVHMTELDGEMWRRLAFRDYVRDHSDEAARYAALKRDLAIRHRADREAYTAAKSAYVDGVMSKAEAGLMLLDVEIRHATPGDAEAVRHLLVETWHDTYDELFGAAKVAEVTGRWHAVDVLNEQLALRAASFLLAERRREIIGHTFARETQPGALFLSRLYVLPSCQRKGIGSRLLQAVSDRHPEAARMVLNVEAANIKGVAFYRRHGFAVVDEKTEDGLTSLRLEKALR